MKKMYGGQKAKRGLYFDVASRAFIHILTDDESLPGEPGQVYLKLNTLELIMFALFMGASYALFLPLVGWVIVCYAIIVHVTIFVAQKILCRIIKKICEAEHWLCSVTNRLCKQCGKECEDNVTMLVKGFVLTLFLLAGMAIGKYLLS